MIFAATGKGKRGMSRKVKCLICCIVGVLATAVTVGITIKGLTAIIEFVVFVACLLFFGE